MPFFFRFLVFNGDGKGFFQNMLDQETWLKTEEDLAVLCALVDSLLTDQQDQPADAYESEDFEDEQRLLARVVHLIKSDTVDDQFLVRFIFSTNTVFSY